MYTDYFTIVLFKYLNTNRISGKIKVKCVELRQRLAAFIFKLKKSIA